MNDPDEPILTPVLKAVIYADRLELYAQRIKAKLWSGDHRLQINALADAAEANQVSARLYGYLKKMINGETE
jgi:hypothetical protein